MSDIDHNDFMTTPVAARLLGLSESRIRQLELAGTIPPARRIGRFRAYSEGDVEQLRNILAARRTVQAQAKDG